jgi:DNA polymerase-3 subunit beta
MTTLPREPLLHAAKTAARCAKGKTVPILSCLRIGQGQVVATDMTREITVLVPGLDLDPLCVDATRLVNALQAIPAHADVTLTHQGNRLTVKSGRARYHLATLPAQDHPDLVRPTNKDSSTVATAATAAAFLVGLSAVQHAAARDDARHYLNGALIEHTPETIAALAATDGHRLAAWPETAAANKPAPGAAILPRESIADILQITAATHADDLTVTVCAGHTTVTADDTTYVTKNLEGRYPEWRRLTQHDKDAHDITLNRHDLAQALRQARVTANDQVMGVLLHIGKEECRLESHNPHEEQGEITIPCQSPQDIEVGYRIGYLLDALEALPDTHDDEITLNVHPKNKTTLHAGGLTQIIMPIRL